jgi:hypothetical protein
MIGTYGASAALLITPAIRDALKIIATMQSVPVANSMSIEFIAYRAPRSGSLGRK